MRIKSFEDFVGQDKIKEHLRIVLDNAKSTGEMDHILITGLRGFGKTTLARICAKELGWEFQEFDLSGGDVMNVMTHLYNITNDKRLKLKSHLIYLDEVHGAKSSSEILLKVMEEKKVLGKPVKFTFVASTNRMGLLPDALLSRFQIKYQLSKYSSQEMVTVIKHSARIAGITITDDACSKIEQVSRGIPREAQNILRRCNDFGDSITLPIVNNTLYHIGIDDTGLTDMDLRYLNAIEAKKNKPQSLKNLEVLVDEEPSTIEKVIEPYLIERGFVDRTPRGRILTAEGLEYIGSDLPAPGISLKDLLK